jgi:hypothetical protein
MPAVVAGHFLLIHRLGQINFEKCFRHGQISKYQWIQSHARQSMK